MPPTNLQWPWTGCSGASFHCVLICVVPVRGTHGSQGLIHQADTPSDTPGWGSLIEALQRLYEHLFFFCLPVLNFPDCLWATRNALAVNGRCQHTLHSPHALLFHHCSVPKVPLYSFIFFIGKRFKLCLGPQPSAIMQTMEKGKYTSLCINV